MRVCRVAPVGEKSNAKYPPSFRGKRGPLKCQLQSDGPGTAITGSRNDALAAPELRVERATAKALQIRAAFRWKQRCHPW